MLTIAGIFFVLAGTLAFYPHNIFQDKKISAPAVKGAKYHKASPTLTPIQSGPTLSPSLTPPLRQGFEGQAPIRETTAGPHPIAVQSTTTTAPTTVTQTPTPSSPDQIGIQSGQAQTVNMQVIEPDGTTNFSVTLHSGNTLCDTLTDAKDEGKIRSVTLDDSYMSSFHSMYIREINGYQNNWTVSVDGKSPKGCSLYTPAQGDSIVWKFG